MSPETVLTLPAIFPHLTSQLTVDTPQSTSEPILTSQLTVETFPTFHLTSKVSQLSTDIDSTSPTTEIDMVLTSVHKMCSVQSTKIFQFITLILPHLIVIPFIEMLLIKIKLIINANLEKSFYSSGIRYF
jgi:hypothetical protein